MEPVKFNRKSLCYRLATSYPEHDESNIPDICSYRAAILRGALVAIMLTCTAAFIGSLAIYPLIWIAACISVAALINPFTDFMFGFSALVWFMALMFISYLWQESENGFASMVKTKIKHSALAHAYQSFKEKKCYPVSFED